MSVTLGLNGSSSMTSTSLLQRIGLRIRQSLELSVILEATTSEIQQFLQCDRVMIYQFQADGSGQVIAEQLGPNQPLPSLHQLFFPADDIPESARQLFLAAGVRNVIDVKSGRIGQSRSYHPETGQPLEEDWIFRPLDPCHAEYLTAMGVQSSLVVPIIYQANRDQMWGLLVAHHATTLTIDDEARDNIQMVVDQMSIAISQSILLKQAQEIAQKEATINRISEQLASMEALDLEAALRETVAVLNGSGGRLYLEAQGEQEPRLYTQGAQPIVHPLSPIPILEKASAIDRFFSHPISHPISDPTRDQKPQYWAIDDLYQVPALRTLQPLFQNNSISGMLILPILSQQKCIGYLTLFRDQVQTETLWAGEFDPDVRQSYPRQSFQIWKQSCDHQVTPWTDSDLDLAQAIAAQFATAITQTDLHHQVQALNLNLKHLNENLELQIETRTHDLKQANLKQDLLFQVVAKIRQSLDLETIFKITTTEVRQILKADRVGIYRFDRSSKFNDGEIIAEDVLPPFTSALTVKVHDHCFGDHYADLYRDGRVHALSDIHHADLADCYRAVLEQFEIQATLVAPILRGENLWGLFCVHQCDRPRDWKPSEIQFIRQISSQVSIALEQAHLLQHTQQQATAMAQVVSELRNTQIQLVHQEKMSSLGRLVAGIAHEINNPVNFIHGNISYVNQYIEEMMAMVKYYEAEITQPSADLQAKLAEIDWEYLCEDLPKIMGSMRLGTDRIREIVLSLRNFSRLDQATFKSVNLHEGIDSTLLIIQHRLNVTSNRPAIIITKDYGDLPLIECYAGSLNQVLMNIVSNAIDAIEEHWLSLDPIVRHAHLNEILIQTRCHTREDGTDRIRICIQDNGAGIPDNQLQHIFDPFYTTKPVGKGTGLGLSISHQIVTEHHYGELSCISCLGSGSTFVIDLPVIHPRSILG